MAAVRVEHTIGDLLSDEAKIISQAKRDLPKVVRRNVKEGGLLTQRIAQGASGPHGKNYYKRITLGDDRPAVWRVRPDRHRRRQRGRRRLASQAREHRPREVLDIIGPKFARDVGNIADDLFWPS
jgi:hypothetical protein